MDEPVVSAAGESAGGPQKPKLTGWRRVLVVAGMVAFGLRVLLALLMHAGGHGRPSEPVAAVGGRIVQWPAQAGDVLRFQPGDPNVAKWAADPKNDALIVSKVISGGDAAVPNTTVCVFAPDYVADASQPGGTMTVEGHDLVVGWRVHWQGGDTVPAELKKPDYDPRCGQDTELLLTATQMHDLINMLQGLPQPAPEPDGVPVGTTIPLPQK